MTWSASAPTASYGPMGASAPVTVPTMSQPTLARSAPATAVNPCRLTRQGSGERAAGVTVENWSGSGPSRRASRPLVARCRVVRAVGPSPWPSAMPASVRAPNRSTASAGDGSMARGRSAWRASRPSCIEARAMPASMRRARTIVCPRRDAESTGPLTTAALPSAARPKCRVSRWSCSRSRALCPVGPFGAPAPIDGSASVFPAGRRLDPWSAIDQASAEPGRTSTEHQASRDLLAAS